MISADRDADHDQDGYLMTPIAPAFITTTGQSAPLRRIGTFGLAVGAACAFSLGIAGQVAG
jgi:hypothetical protein